MKVLGVTGIIGIHLLIKFTYLWASLSFAISRIQQASSPWASSKATSDIYPELEMCLWQIGIDTWPRWDTASTRHEGSSPRSYHVATEEALRRYAGIIWYVFSILHLLLITFTF